MISRAISKGDLTVLRRDLKATATMWKQAARLDLPELVFVLPLEKVVCLPARTNCSSSVLRARRKRLLQYSRMSDRQLERLFCDETVSTTNFAQSACCKSLLAYRRCTVCKIYIWFRQIILIWSRHGLFVFSAISIDRSGAIIRTSAISESRSRSVIKPMQSIVI